MWHLLRTRRWIGFTTLVVVVIVAFGLLSRWQWHRAEEKRLEHAAMTTAGDAAPVTITRGARPEEWQPATTTGTFIATDQVVVRKRPLDATNGFWVLAPLRLADGSTLWVNRGWIPVTGAATDLPAMPQPPSGPVTVSGWWRLMEAGDVDPTGLPAGMVPQAAPAYLPTSGDYDGYLQVAEASPPSAELTPVPRETVDDSRNVSYAVQWILFAIVAVVGWFVFLRREAREDQAQESTHGG